MLNRRKAYEVEAKPEADGTQDDGEPQRLLGELSRASQSLSEVLDSIVAEKRELESRLASLEAQVDHAQAELESARNDAAAEVERARLAAATTAKFAAVDAARERARAERAEQLLAAVGRDRHSSVFCVSVGRLERGRVSREILREAVRSGVQMRLSAHRGWLGSLLVVEAEGDAAPLRDFLGWARQRFADADFREDRNGRTGA
jgi:hypothetical protein